MRLKRVEKCRQLKYYVDLPLLLMSHLAIYITVDGKKNFSLIVEISERMFYNGDAILEHADN